jgi:hypothetical protein
MNLSSLVKTDDLNLIPYVFYGRFEEWGGSTNIQRDVFNRIKNTLQKVCGKSTFKRAKTYYFRNMRKIYEDKYGPKLVADHYVSNKTYGEFNICFCKESKVYDENFPTIFQYHNITEEKIFEFTVGKSAIVQLKEEFYNKSGDERVYSIMIKILGVDQSDVSLLDKVHRVIIKEIS